MLASLPGSGRPPGRQCPDVGRAGTMP
eukprot:COSAG01_NODE_15754_length_1303_cov_1.174419_2_plen_26_part_01